MYFYIDFFKDGRLCELYQHFLSSPQSIVLLVLLVTVAREPIAPASTTTLAEGISLLLLDLLVPLRLPFVLQVLVVHFIHVGVCFRVVSSAHVLRVVFKVELCNLRRSGSTTLGDFLGHFGIVDLVGFRQSSCAQASADGLETAAWVCLLTASLMLSN